MSTRQQNGDIGEIVTFYTQLHSHTQLHFYLSFKRMVETQNNFFPFLDCKIILFSVEGSRHWMNFKNLTKIGKPTYGKNQ